MSKLSSQHFKPSIHNVYHQSVTKGSEKRHTRGTADMTAMNGDINGAAAPLSWTEFCEQHAALAAEDFARSFHLYVQDHQAYNSPSSCQEFAEKFVEYFMEHFEAQTVFRTPQGSPTKSPKKRPQLTTRSHTFDTATGGGGAGTSESGGAFGGVDLDDGDDDKTAKSFFRRFSFRGIKSTVNRPFRQLFKQHSDEMEFSGKFKLRNEKNDKAKMTKMLVECRKEGIVHQLIGEDYNGLTQWEKCRLVLIKTTGGYMLEFYTPPKVSTHM